GTRRDKIPGDLSGQELALRFFANSKVPVAQRGIGDEGLGGMTFYAAAIDRRFGDGGPSGGDGDNDFIRRVLSRKTVRRYSDVVPDDSLLDLLVAASLSASAKSDFQQASILRVTDPAK